MKVPNSMRDLMEGAESLVYVEDLSGKKGVMQAVNPVAKLIATVGIIVAAIFITNLSYLLAICFVPLVLSVTSRIPLKHFFQRTAMITVFSAFITLPVIFTTSGNLVLVSNISGFTIAITAEGLTSAAMFTVRVWFCVASLVMLVLSTGFEKTLKLLATLKVPAVIIQLFSLTYRYFFVSVHEAQSVLMAKEARTYLHKHSFNFQSLRDLGAVFSSLFIRTYERSERVYLAMKARGFEITNESKLVMPKLRIFDVAFASILIVGFAYLACL